MTRYFVKITQKGTPSNPNFAGVEKTFIHGKNNYVSEDESLLFLDRGYTSFGMALRELRRRKQNDDQFYANTKAPKYHTFSYEVLPVSK